MSRSDAAGSPSIAVLSAAGTGLAFQICLLALVAALPGAGYLAFGVVVNAVAAVIVGLAFARGGGGVAAALTVWAVLQTAFFFPAPRNVVLAAAFGVVTAILLARGSRTSAATPGIVVGGALCLALVVFPRALLLIDADFPAGPVRDALRVATYAALVALVPAVAALRRVRPRLPSAGALMVAGLVAAAAVTPGTWRERPWVTSRPGTDAPQREIADRPSILVLVLDTVRADHLSLYGYPRATSPELAAFVERSGRARVYPLAFSPAPWTVPAHASLLTGLLPSSHGAHSGNVVDAGRTKSVPGIRAERTLAEALRAKGYATAGIFANVHLGTTRGLERGFDVWFQPRRSRPLFLLAEKSRERLAPWLLPDAAKPYPDADTVAGEVLRFVDAAGSAPWFVMANFMEAHQPYAARAPFAGRFAARSRNPPVLARADDPPARKELARDRYDEELASLDAAVGNLLAELERRDRLARAWIVITSDHGEAFGEHGTVNHGSSVYNEQVRIPLIVIPPEGVTLPARDDAVGLLDVATTLAAIGTDGDRLGAGADLRRPRGPDEEPARVEFFGNPRQTGRAVRERWGALWNTPARAVVRGDTKLVEHSARRELYDLSDDPRETRDLSGARADATAALAPLLPPLAATVVPPQHTLTPDERDALRALGYLDD